MKSPELSDRRPIRSHRPADGSRASPPAAASARRLRRPLTPALVGGGVASRAAMRGIAARLIDGARCSPFHARSSTSCCPLEIPVVSRTMPTLPARSGTPPWSRPAKRALQGPGLRADATPQARSAVVASSAPPPPGGSHSLPAIRRCKSASLRGRTFHRLDYSPAPTAKPARRSVSMAARPTTPLHALARPMCSRAAARHRSRCAPRGRSLRRAT
jgi:hypothetical protein